MNGTLISWNVPNLITIWLMLFIGFLVLALAAQFGLGLVGSRGEPAAGAGGW